VEDVKDNFSKNHLLSFTLNGERPYAPKLLQLGCEWVCSIKIKVPFSG